MGFDAIIDIDTNTILELTQHNPQFESGVLPYITSLDYQSGILDLNPTIELTPATIIDLWDNTDLTDHL